MPVSTDQVEMSGAAFVPVCVKVHGSSPPLSVGGPSFNRQLPKQFPGRLPIAASPTRPRARGGLKRVTPSPPSRRPPARDRGRRGVVWHVGGGGRPLWVGFRA